MSVSAVSPQVHAPLTKPNEATEGPGPDHDRDGDEAGGAVGPTAGQPAPGGGIYL